MDWKQQLTAQLHMLMGSLHKASAQAFEKRLEDNNISLSMLQVHLMRILDYDGDMTSSELSRIMRLDPSTLVPSVNGLAEKGYVARNRDPKDRRRVILTLTPEGKALSDDLLEIPQDHIIVEAIGKLGEDDAHQLLNLMQQLLSHVPEGDNILEQIKCRLEPMLRKGEE